MKKQTLATIVAAVVLGGACASALAQGSAAEGIARYREMLQDGNPAELTVARGEEIWKAKRGPKNVSLEQCDLGIGPGVIKGAYAQLPRYFADADQVMDFESRVVWCMVNLQGMDRAAITKSPYSGAGQRQTDIEALAAFGAEMSRGMPVNISQSHPKERAVVRSRQAGFLHARWTVRLFLRHLPRRDGAAHPPAGPAEHLQQQTGRGSCVHDLAGLSRVAGGAALDAVAPV